MSEDQESHNQDRQEPDNEEEVDEDYNVQEDSDFGREEETFEVEDFAGEQEGEEREVEQPRGNLGGNPMEQFMDLLRQNLNQYPQQPPPRNANVANSFRAFKSLKPPEFQGSADPVEARAWLKEMEKSFEILSI